MRIAVFCVIQLLGTSLFFSQNVSGVIIDGTNDTKLSNVKVTDESTGTWTVTDAQGKFSLKYTNGAKLTFYKSGWIAESTELEGDKDQNLQMKLFPASIRIADSIPTIGYASYRFTH